MTVLPEPPSVTTEIIQQHMQGHQDREEFTSEDATTGNSTLLVPLQVQGTGTTVIFCPSFRNTAMFYQDLAGQLAPDMAVYSFNWPEPAADNPPADTLPLIAEEFLQSLKICVPHGPFIIGGFCFGSVIALEMAKQLAALGEQVDLLVLIDPVRPSTGNQWQRWQLRRLHSIRVFRKHGIRFFIRSQYRSGVTMVQYLRSGTRERLEHQFHTAHHRAFSNYQAKPCQNRTLLVFSHAEHQENETERSRHQDARWREILPQNREILILADWTHQTILCEGAGKVAARIKAIAGEIEKAAL